MCRIQSNRGHRGAHSGAGSGKKRIGLALSDELGFTAQGLETMEREGRRDDIEVLRRLAVEHNVKLILMGDPLHMSGAPSRQGDYTREFARELEYKQACRSGSGTNAGPAAKRSERCADRG